MKKLNKNAQNILKMMSQKNTEEFAYWLDVILDDLASTVDNRAVAEFHFVDNTSEKVLASSCYVTPPAKGEFIRIKNSLFEILAVIHSFDRATEPGKIFINPVDTILIM